MNIRLGVYEIFSRIVPGGLYLAATAQLLIILGLLKFDLESVNSLSLITSIGLLLSAYTIGGAFDRLALAWFRLFAKRGTHTRRFANFKQNYQERWEIDFNGSDWAILLAFIRTRNLELASEIDRNNAVSIMFLGVNSLIQFLILRNGIYVFVLLILIGMSLLIIQEAKKFREWYYDSIFQTILAYRIDLESVIKPAKNRKVKQ